MEGAKPASNRVLIMGNGEQHQRVALALESAGFQVLQVPADRDGLVHAMEDAPHLVVLSTGTPPEVSMGLLGTLRDVVSAPIIVVGPAGDVPMLQALMRGADIYLTPQTSSAEIVAYARALLRRNAPVDPATAGPLLQEEILPPASLPGPDISCCPSLHGTTRVTYRLG